MESNEYVIRLDASALKDSTSDGNGGSSAQKSVKKVTEPLSFRDQVKQLRGDLQKTGVTMVAGMAIDYVTSRVGVTTGNYQLQAEISAGKRVLGTVAGIGAAFFFGGAGAGILATVGVGLSAYLQYDQYRYERNQYEEILSIQRERAGIDMIAQNFSRREER